MKLGIRSDDYNPQDEGALCAQCPLERQCKKRRFVSPSPNANSPLVVLGEYPGIPEIRDDKILTGTNGYLTFRAFEQVGVSRRDLHITNAVLCAPPAGNKPTPREWKKILAACKPRLNRELAGRKVLAMGKLAMVATYGKGSPKPWRGAPLGNIFPTFASYAARVNPALIPVLGIDIGRAWRWSNGRLPEWEWPEIHIHEGPAMLSAIKRLAESGMPLGVDVETAGINPRTAPLLCVGVASRDLAVSVNWTSEFITPEMSALSALIRSNQAKVMQNAQHDILTLRHNNIAVGGDCFDTLLAHHVVAPQLPHDLGTIASCYFHAPRWKTLFGASSDEKGLAVFTNRPAHELRTYNAKDALMTAKLEQALRVTLENTYRGEEQNKILHELALVAMEMRDYGVEAVEENRLKHEKALEIVIKSSRKEFEESLPLSHVLVGKKKYRKSRYNDERGKNERCAEYQSETLVYCGPYRLGASGQMQDLNKLFFEVWGIKPREFSVETGEPKLDRDLLSFECGNSNPLISGTARRILQFRAASKLLSTYVRGLPVESDGIVRPTFKVYGTKTGRWSSAEPNAQNIPAKMRDMFRARDGRWLLAADYSQLELRITALLSGDTKLLEWYRQGYDVHTEVAKDVFRVETVSKAQRSMTKGVVYGMSYGGGAETIWRTLLPRFPKVQLAFVKRVIKSWYDEHPAIRTMQDDWMEIARETNYVEVPFSGRREYFHDGRIEPTKVFNFPIQGGAGDIMNESILHLEKLCYDTDVRIIFQVHDEIVIEGSDPHQMYDMLKKSMSRSMTRGGNTVDFPVDMAIGKNWGEMVDEVQRGDLDKIMAELLP